MSPRHVLTPEERARGHKLTAADRAKGGRNVPWAKRMEAALKYPAHITQLIEAGRAHRFTPETSRLANRRGMEKRKTIGYRFMAKLVDAHSHDDSVVDAIKAKLQAAESICSDGGREENQRPEPETLDPFTLSALKRFRLGPVSPLQLTRSQRAHVQVMRDAGYLEADGVSMLRLTEKGRQALGGEG